MAHDDAAAGTTVPDHDGATVHAVVGAMWGMMAIVMVPITVLDDDAIGECRAGDEKGDGGGGSEQQFLHFFSFSPGNR